MAELAFFSGTMDCGKSTLTLQTVYNHECRGMRGPLHSRNDRARTGRLSSRIGLEPRASEVDENTNFWKVVAREQTGGREVGLLIHDGVQFYTEAQIEQLARIVDEIEAGVSGFEITSDFMMRLFPGSARMIEFAGKVEVLQVRVLCWCGKRAMHNACTVNGVMVTGGEQVVVGDINVGKAGYEVLCRYHHMRRMTASMARAAKQFPLGES